MSRERAIWLFGYGSIIWKPGFSFQASSTAWIRGYKRRFWQGSTDHRGVPGNPGRVVTLVPEPGAVCSGVAFCIDPEESPESLRQLDHREKGGYERIEAKVELADRREPVTGLVYFAGPDNPNYLGPASVAAIARQVARCRGPSGNNRDYVLELARALREMGVQDEHVFAVEAALLRQTATGSG